MVLKLHVRTFEAMSHLVYFGVQYRNRFARRSSFFFSFSKYVCHSDFTSGVPAKLLREILFSSKRSFSISHTNMHSEMCLYQ